MARPTKKQVEMRRRQQGALLVAQDILSDWQIAEECAISRRTLDNWKNNAEFQALVQEHRETWQKELIAVGLADKQARLKALNDRWERLAKVIKARASDELMQEIPGGDTGLVTSEPMLIKVYSSPDPDDETAILFPTRESRVIRKYVLDANLLRELREIEKQAAQELGEWVEKKKVDSDVNHNVLIREYEGVPGDFV